jgi:hypothetical protein
VRYFQKKKKNFPQRASSSTGQDNDQEEFTSLEKNTSLDEPVPDDQGVQDGARSECFTIKNTKGEETFRLQPY